MSAAEQPMSQDAFIARLTLEQVTRAQYRLDETVPILDEFKTRHDQVVGAPGQAVIDLSRLLQLAANRIVVVEVNFDQLVEAHAGVDVRIFATEEEFVEAPDYIRRYLGGDEQAVPILKLHGTIDRPETCIINSGQTELGLGQSKLDSLRALLSPNNPRLWIYVGASLRDFDLRPVLLGEDFARGLNELWVSPYLDASVEEFAIQRSASWRQTSWPNVDDRLVAEAADPFFTAWRESVEAL